MIDPAYYSIDLPLAVWLLMGFMVMAMIIIAFIFWSKLLRVSRRAKADTASIETLPEEDTDYPATSVIVYSQSDGANLRTLLPAILNQDYPAPMEVIVVNDSGMDNTETIVSELELSYPNLYMTFAPENSRNLSRRKLSITLGIKAARYDKLLLTCGNCRIDSERWMRGMMRHFSNKSTQVVIGYAYPSAYDGPDNDRRRRRRSFDQVWQSVRYLSAAIHHHPFMGCGYNLAYDRHLFFEHKGYSRTLNLNFGDDDLFINEIATPANTAVELSKEAQVAAMEQSPAAFSRIYAMRRDFTARSLPRHFYYTPALTSWMWWLWPAAGAGAVAMSLPSLVAATGVAILTVAFCLTHAALWRRCSVALNGRRLFLTVPFLAWSRPLRTLWMRAHSRRFRSANLTQLI